MRTYLTILLIVVSVFTCTGIFGQGTSAVRTYQVKGFVGDEKREAVVGATVALKSTSYQTETDKYGKFELKNIPVGDYVIIVFSMGRQTIQEPITIDKSKQRDFYLSELREVLDEVSVAAAREQSFGLSRLNAIENFGVYEGKKTEVVVIADMTVNTATNNARQLYSKVTGLNIWESDQVGLQLGIGGRGLSPNRTSNFNTRQNGYDISADALGYPESYYTPPAEALDQIEIIRGAASLQYGTQFGGLLNFRFKKGPADKAIEWTSRQSVGSWGFFGAFNSVGGTVAGNKLNYYAYYNYRRGDGYRSNSAFDYHNAYASLDYKINSNFSVNVDITKMYYLAQQAGGLTDRLFEDSPRQSIRARNWFKVDWNMIGLNATYRFSHLTQLNIRNFGLVATRKSLGNLDPINVADLGGNRSLIDGQFQNIGHETRLLHRYMILNKQHALLAGFRLYRGITDARQGDANDATGPDFYFLNPRNLENSDYRFPNENYSFFVENIFDITSRLSVTPGLRYEDIRTFSDGYYTHTLRDGARNIIVQRTYSETLERKREFVIGGLGISYKHTDHTELYGNISQNYRAINFTDLRIENPNLVVDPNIHDEKGFTADAGARGRIRDILKYEITGFYLSYNGKIGNVLRTDEVLYKDYRFRGNIADARNLGVEAFGELNISRLLKKEAGPVWSVFINSSLIDAQYTTGDFAGKKVEMVPPFMARLGVSVRRNGFSSSLQFAHTGKHYSDATNRDGRTASAIEGAIPAYQVVDLTASYTWKWLSIEASCNNLLDQKYFTRRADSYPGPGIIPADGRGFYLTVQSKLGK